MRRAQWIKFLLFSILILAVAAPSFAHIRVSIRFGPPPLPVYEQPLCPGPNYMWTPGYWAYDYDDQDYYWVPGTWVQAPQVGFLWTPGWWGWGGEGFIFHEGFWGPVVGFYGGINYGYGYFGNGYEGGRWDRDQFYYNRAVNNVNVTEIHNTYNTTVINNTTVNRVSYNGGQGGINARPTPQQEAAARERHLPPVQTQVQHSQLAKADPQQRASVNHGKPVVAASARPTQLKGAGVVPAKEAGGAYNPPPRGAAENNRAANGQSNNAPPATQRPENGNRSEANPPRNETNQARPEASQSKSEANQPRQENEQRPSHAKDVQPWKPAAPAQGSKAMMDQKYQKQQQKLATQQEKQRQKLETQQERDHQKIAQKQDEARKQQVEQQHQQQTQKMQERQNQQRQQLQQKYQPAPPPKSEPHNEPPRGL